MSTITKIIGRLPVRRDYVSGGTYYLYNLVTYLGSSWICTVNSTTNTPASLNSEGKPVANDGWEVFSDSTNSYIVESDVDRINRDFGRYSNPTAVKLSQSVEGKYVHKDTAKEVSASGYGISAPISLKKGDILLVPSSSPVVAACSVVSRKVTNTFDKVIIYSYTYEVVEDIQRIKTATADYDTSLVYTAVYSDETSSSPLYWTKGESTYISLPSTHSVTTSFYEPLVKQSVAAMPSEGYYVYLSSEAMDVVISGFTATVNGGTALIVGWGIFKNIASNFVGNDGQRVLAEAINQLEERVSSISDSLENGLGSLSVKKLRIERELDGLLISSITFLEGEGAPSVSVVPLNWQKKYWKTFGDWTSIPLFKGQIYYDKTNDVVYIAVGTDSVNDWKRISNA